MVLTSREHHVVSFLSRSTILYKLVALCDVPNSEVFYYLRRIGRVSSTFYENQMSNQMVQPAMGISAPKTNQ